MSWVMVSVVEIRVVMCQMTFLTCLVLTDHHCTRREEEREAVTANHFKDVVTWFID